MKMKILIGVIFPILMAQIMGVLMAFALVAINVGFSNVGIFFKAWGGSTLICFAVALPISLGFFPILQKGLMKLADDALPQEKVELIRNKRDLNYLD